MSKHHPKESSTKAVGLITLTDPTSPISEQFRTIRTNIQFASSSDKRLQTMVITSSGPGEGKSTTSANLAVVFAKSGQRVLLVDADLRKPTVYKTFQLNNAKGLSTILSTTQNATEIVQDSGIENLSVLTSGPKPPNPSELLGSVRMNQVIQELRNAYDIVIFDMPPVVTVTDAQIMASKVDGTLLVIRENVTNKESVAKAADLLKLVNARILGTVYNGATQTKDQGYYYY
ncbi:CpsD/CapB family tyrosine-protein kinase [Enterococcus sp.]|uniref:CpsD/CapB family tyrosine-protein kinase n=1 Tax=Enterococcus sp. TaxID=35783 RepID=UPI002FC5922A